MLASKKCPPGLKERAVGLVLDSRDADGGRRGRVHEDRAPARRPRGHSTRLTAIQG